MTSPSRPGCGTGRATDLLRLLGIARSGVSLERELALEFGRSYHLMYRRVSDSLAVLNLTPQQYGLLEVLVHSPRGMAQDDLRSLFFCSKPNMSGLGDRLVVSGFVKRVRDTKDKRRRILTVTPHGRAILRKARPVYRGAVANFFAPLPRGEQQKLLSLIRKVRLPIEEAV